MPDAALAYHVGDVEETVDAVEVDEGPEIGEIFDRALADVARGHVAQEFGPLFGALLLDKLAAGKNDVLAVLVDLDDFEGVGVPNEHGKILGGDDVDLGGGQEGLDADIHDQPAS